LLGHGKAGPHVRECDNIVKSPLLISKSEPLSAAFDNTVTPCARLPRPQSYRARKGNDRKSFDTAMAAVERYTRAMRAAGPEHSLKAQLARELCAILQGYRRDIGAACFDAHASELSRLRHGDLRRFSLGRIVRYLARAGYDIEVHLKKTSRLEHRPEPRRPTSVVLRYDYYGQVIPADSAARGSA